MTTRIFQQIASPGGQSPGNAGGIQPTGGCNFEFNNLTISSITKTNKMRVTQQIK